MIILKGTLCPNPLCLFPGNVIFQKNGLYFPQPIVSLQERDVSYLCTKSWMVQNI